MFGTYILAEDPQDDPYKLNIPKNATELSNLIRKNCITKTDFQNTKAQQCIICSEMMYDGGAQLIRKCQCKSYPCEGHVCSCCKLESEQQLLSACFRCICENLYKQTSEFMRKQGRYRAKCPFCKADYCQYDIVYCPVQKKQKQLWKGFPNATKQKLTQL